MIDNMLTEASTRSSLGEDISQPPWQYSEVHQLLSDRLAVHTVDYAKIRIHSYKDIQDLQHI